MPLFSPTPGSSTGRAGGPGSSRSRAAISKLYLAHIAFSVACVAALIIATLLLDNPIYQDVLNLEPFFDEPAQALRKALLLAHQPAMLDILPLYVVLLLWFPVLLLLMRIHVLVALAASAALWLGANLLGWNLPTYPENEGWFFNPFAWQLLFSLGVICGVLREQAGSAAVLPLADAAGHRLRAVRFCSSPPLDRPPAIR